MYLNWLDDRKPRDSPYSADPDYEPSDKKPLVYHVFGTVSKPDCIPVTEDDYFSYLVSRGVLHTSNTGVKGDLIPSDVLNALSNRMVVFLGFSLEDWAFRVLFRSIVHDRWRGKWDKHQHVAVQINPVESRGRNLKSVHNYLNKYFQNDRVSVYWGSVEDFTREVLERRRVFV